MARVQLFLSTVSAEFRSYRDALRRDLDRPNVTVKVQEDFIVTGTETLDMLDYYIRQCDAVIHLVGDMTGAPAQAPSLAVIRQRYPDLGEKLPPLAPFLAPNAPALSYTQWEAWLALYHRKVLIIAAPDDGAPRDERFERIPEQRAAQQAHLQRLAKIERYPFRFASRDRLAVEVLRSKLHEILARAGPLARPANLPFRSLGALFKGREATLEELTRSLGPIPDSTATPVVARVLSGLGGVGKTRLAIEYAWQHAEDYTARLFVGADSGEAIQRNLAALCARGMLDLPEQQAQEEARQYEAVLDWLKKTPSWLLILDNVDSKPAAAAAEALLPQLAGGHVLLTSRLADWSAGLAPVPLDVLAPEAAVDFLLARTEAKRRKQTDDPITARTLAEELGRLALALEQAGAYIAHRCLSLNRYLAEWQSQRGKVLAWFDERLMQYPKPLAIAWQTSFDQLTAPARQLLRRLAWLAPEPIPESLLEVPVPEGDGQADAFEALAELASYSLVARAADQPSFTVHRLVQEVTRRSQQEPPPTAPLLDALQWIDAVFTCDPTNPDNWPILNPLLPHARAVSSHADAAGISAPTAQLMLKAGVLLHIKAQYAEAEPLYERALRIDEQTFGPDHPDVANSLLALAELYRDQNAYTQALPLCQRALRIFEQALGPDHTKVANSLNNLAELYRAQGAYTQAKPLYERALKIAEQAFGPDHSHVARTLDNLAGLYSAQGAYAQAEPLYERALRILEQAFGPDHPDVATNLNNLAELYRAQGAYTQAKPLYERALKIYEQTFGPDHPAVATSLNNLAMLYCAQDAYVQAEPLYQRALTIREQAFRPDHPHVAQSLKNLAELYRTQGAYAQLISLYERALKIREQALGPDHPHVAASLSNLALPYFAQGAYAQAELLMRRALNLVIVNFGIAHPNTRTLLGNYEGLLGVMGKTEAEITDALRSLGLGPR